MHGFLNHLNFTGVNQRRIAEKRDGFLEKKTTSTTTSGLFISQKNTQHPPKHTSPLTHIHTYITNTHIHTHTFIRYDARLRKHTQSLMSLSNQSTKNIEQITHLQMSSNIFVAFLPNPTICNQLF